MAARASTHGVVSQIDLRSLTDVAAVFVFFQKLRYPVEPQPIAVPIEYGELPEALRSGIAARYPLARVGGARPGDPSLDVTLFVLAEAERKSALIRGIAANWTRRYPGQHLFVFATSKPGATDFDQLTFVHTERLGDGAQVRVKLRKLIVERSHPTRHDADTLNHIALVSPADSATAAHKAQSDAFNVERMTDQFYKGYSALFKAAVERIAVDNKGVADFYDPSKLHAFAQRLFGRVMFLYFLQKKRALDGNLNFITQHYDAAVRRDQNFYQAVLEPLFFETLNQPRADQRSPLFGRVPYLNGGLFAEDELDHRGVVFLDNALFDPRGDGGMLYFLNNHNFTVEEDTPLEVEVALDPEMLGKVFENLLEAEDRGKSGTFYTPRPVVAFMCREALAAYLTRETGLSGDHLGWLLDEAETGEPVRDDAGNPRLAHHALPRPLREKIEAALTSVRVLDPAVGSGAFPLGMLALLVGVRRALYRVAEVHLPPTSNLVEGWKRNFIRDCLYGVDIKREAIEIARLRLWLSLVVDADPFDMEPLPNLDYKLMVGDSLIETFDGIEIYPTRPANPAIQQGSLIQSGTKTLIDMLHDLQSRYFQPEGTDSRADLKHQIDVTEADIVRVALRERRDAETTQLASLTQRMAKFQSGNMPAQLNAEFANLSRRINLTDEALEAINTGKPLPFFLYRLHFASVFEKKDGFDIVIANPPYVRHEKIAPATLTALKGAYPSVAHGMADLYVYFYARALQLLHEGGTLSFISSNKFFRAGYGKGLRQLLSENTAMHTVLDFGDFPVFDAAAYPCVLISTKGNPSMEHTYRGLVAGANIDLYRLRDTLASLGTVLEQRKGVHAPSGLPSTSDLIDKLMRMGTPLGIYTSNRMYRGVVTGLNKAFVITSEVKRDLIDKDPRSQQIIKPFLRGRDISKYELQSSNLWLIFARQGIDISLYPAVVAHLSEFRSALQPKQPGSDGPGRKPGKYKWFEIQDTVEYYQFFEGPKVIYPDIALRQEFVWDDTGAYLGNTNYFIPTSARHFCALLNSTLIEFIYSTLSPQIRGGYYRYFSQYMEELPIVEPSPADQQRLSDLVDRLQALGGKGLEAQAYEREVDEIVYRTYGLTPDEVRIIEDWHAERRALLGAGKRGSVGDDVALDDDADVAE